MSVKVVNLKTGEKVEVSSEESAEALEKSGKWERINKGLRPEQKSELEKARKMGPRQRLVPEETRLKDSPKGGKSKGRRKDAGRRTGLSEESLQTSLASDLRGSETSGEWERRSRL